MNIRWKTVVIALLGALLVGNLSAKPRVINREQEKEQFPDLQVTEKLQEQNINNVMKRINDFGILVPLAQEDRMQAFKALDNPLDFRYTSRNIFYTPRNTYVRYVKEKPDVITVGLGTVDEVKGIINEKVQEARASSVKANDIQFGGSRDGIELTQFEFIRANIGFERDVVVGSLRKSVTLYFKPAANQGADSQQETQLDMVVTRVVDDNQRNGVRDVELVIDPSPMDDNMDDIVIVHRYNKKVPQAMVVGAMANTPTFPLRVQFKQKFYVKLMDHFFRLYRLVENYAHKDSNKYQENVVEELTDQLVY